ncbi:hypothetical protein EUGRSUZ_D01241 [Eucalyptus grandis]|uniref:Uncharacterized protein n=2 Tax=Eucalyptus grandis TaxID=71139 RepID=A0ACC3L5M4_EUCGR|nr:hypothetical protein EUGRSUZ_D01241 [Eucalyptus grandis]
MAHPLDGWWCFPDLRCDEAGTIMSPNLRLEWALSGFNCIVHAACGFGVTSPYLWTHSPCSFRWGCRMKSTLNFLRVELRISVKCENYQENTKLVLCILIQL